MSLVPLVLVAALSSAPAQAPELKVSVRPAGLDASGTQAVKARLGKELSAAGVRFRLLSSALDASCVESEACVARKVKGAAALLDVDLVRVGPLVQVTARLFGPDGAVLDAAERTAEADSFPGDAPLLEPELLAAVKQHVPSAPAKPATGAEPVAASPGTPTTETEVIDVKPTEEPAGPSSLPVLGYSGIGVAVVGGLLTVGSGLLALHEASVLEDAGSLGDEKSRARVLGPVALGVAGAGVLVLGAGGAMSSIGFAME